MAISCYLCTGWVYGADGNRDRGIATEQNRGREERMWRARRNGERISRPRVDAKAPDSQALVARLRIRRLRINPRSRYPFAVSPSAPHAFLPPAILFCSNSAIPVTIRAIYPPRT